MKKALVSFFALMLVFTATVPVSAADNSDAVISALRSGVTVNGTTVAIPASYINQAENYFASHTITDAQASYILAQINAAKSEIKAAGITDLSKIDGNTKRKILAAAQAAANNIDLKLTVGSNKNVQIAGSSGKIVFADGNPIKTTGMQADSLNPFPAVLFLAGAAGICGYLIVKNRLLEYEC